MPDTAVSPSRSMTYWGRAGGQVTAERTFTSSRDCQADRRSDDPQEISSDVVDLTGQSASRDCRSADFPEFAEDFVVSFLSVSVSVCLCLCLSLREEIGGGGGGGGVFQL